jgi:HEAT repeat protein
LGTVAEALGEQGQEPDRLETAINSLIAKRSWDELARIGPATVEPLIACLVDQDSFVRSGAIRALAKLGDVRAVEPLITRLNDERNLSVLEETIKALGHLGDRRAVDPLITALKERSWWVRWRTEMASGKSRDASTIATGPMIAILRDRERFARQQAVETLGMLGDPKVVQTLVMCLKDEDPIVRHRSAAALAKLEYEPATPEDRIILLIAKRDWEQLAKSGPLAVEPLIARLGDKGWGVRKQTLGPTRVELEYISGQDWYVRSGAAEALGQLGDTRATQPLLACLQDIESYVHARITAAKALGSIGDRRAIPDLVKCLPDWPARKTLRSTLSALGWYPSTDTEKVYWSLAGDNVSWLQENWRLVHSVLLTNAESRGVREREYGICALVALGREDTVPELLDVFGRRASIPAAKILLNSGHPRLREAAEGWAKLRGYLVVMTPGDMDLVSWGQIPVAAP